jgi:D,D-heptose 1,7-bisphosphate phosphatase
VADFELLPTVPQAIRLLNENGFKVVVVTNQSGIARGYFTEETLEQIHQKMKDELAEHHAWVDAIYYCPHHPDDGCECRKPRTALFLKAAKELDIDLSRSYMVGDMQMDIDAGKALGCQTILVSNDPQSPDHAADNLLAAAERIVGDLSVTNTIIIPAFNEEQGLPVVLEKIFSVIDGDYEVIVMDDGSTDHTPEVASRFPCRVVRHKVNGGKGKVLRAGIALARGENIIWTDSDDTYPADKIPDIARALSDGLDLVYASRMAGRDRIPTFNRVGNALFRLLIRGMYGFEPYDPCTGLCGVKKHHLAAMELQSKRFAIEPEIAMKAGRMKLKMLDMPIEYRPRIGQAKLNSITVGFEDMLMILRLLFWRPKKGGKGE